MDFSRAVFEIFAVFPRIGRFLRFLRFRREEIKILGCGFFVMKEYYITSIVQKENCKNVENWIFGEILNFKISKFCAIFFKIFVQFCIFFEKYDR